MVCLPNVVGPNGLVKIFALQAVIRPMKKVVTSAILSSAMVATVLVAPAGAQVSGSLCNGLEPTIVGTNGDDVIQGTFEDDVIFAGAGNDQIRGASGADVICGGSGDDVIYGDSQSDVIFGGAGNDVIRGGAAADEIYGDDGNDVIYGDSQSDVIYGGVGNDVIHGGADVDEVHGGDGDDEIYGNSQNDALFGDDGDDYLNGGPDEDTLDGGAGFDVADGSWQNDTCSNTEETLSCENIVAGTSSAAGTGTESASTEGPVLLTEAELQWIQGSSEWVNLLWTTDTELQNVEVRLASDSAELEVEYPSDTNRSLPSVDQAISVSEMDFTAVKLTANGSESLSATIQISWDDAQGERQTRDFPLTLTNQVYEGEDFAILTDAVTVGTDVEDPGHNWVDLDYRGISPRNSAISVVANSDDLPVYHPQVDFTSLHHDEVLHGGETDVARVWFDPDLAVPGTFTVVIEIDYVDTNGVEKTTSHEVELTVEES